MWKFRAAGGGLTVGLVHWALPPTIGGVESHLADYIRLLTQRGVEVVVLTGERKPLQQLADLAEIHSNPLLRLAGGGEVPDDGPECIDELTTWFGQVLAGSGVDVVHAHNLHYFSSAPATALNEVCWKLDIARHHTFHNYWADGAHVAGLIENWEGRWANSEFVAGLCDDGYLGSRPRTRYMGIDPDRFIRRRKPFEGRDPTTDNPALAPLILQPARLLRWKGPMTSVRMLRLLHDNDYRARLLITDTSQFIDWDDERKALRAELNDQIDELKLSRWVEFSDDVFYAGMPELYDEADIVINPSHGEPLGLVALEAMAAARPVVVTDSGGMTETFDQRTGAVVADDRSLAENLFEAVRGFLDDPRSAVRSGRRGRRHVVKNFHMNVYVDAMLDAYRATLKPQKARLAAESVSTSAPHEEASMSPVGASSGAQ
jgi:glycosyltransferase involved in cell wall biosynthesis